MPIHAFLFIPKVRCCGAFFAYICIHYIADKNIKVILLISDTSSNFFFLKLTFLSSLELIVLHSPSSKAEAVGREGSCKELFSCLLELRAALCHFGPWQWQLGTPGSRGLLHRKEQASFNALYLTDIHCSYSGFSFCPRISGILAVFPRCSVLFQVVVML